MVWEEEIPSFAMAGVKLICGLLVATTLLGCCNGGPDGLLRGYVAELSALKFDYFVFSQEWPGTYCESKASCCQRLKEPVKFSIHGVWPEFNDGSWPECCDGPAFNMTKVEDLADDLQKYWPTLYCSPPRQCNGKVTGNFWQHEWEKHGTCAYPTIIDEAAFFKIGLLLNQKYDLLEMLSEAGIVPHSKTRYKATSMEAAIRKHTGFKPKIVCQAKQIKEIYVCFDKTFKPRHCGSSVSSRAQKLGELGKSGCSGYVLLPPLKVSGDVEDM